MKTLLKNGQVINVFTGEIELVNVLLEGDKIIGVDQYDESDADEIIDVAGKYICPGFIDGHIHIESTMMTPVELAKACMPHGTTTIVADPHEIANVCGTKGISYMMKMSKGIPLHVYFMLPSCVPAMAIDESGACLEVKELEPFYHKKRVLGLAEMMNYAGVIDGDKKVLAKVKSAHEHGMLIDGHAPLLHGKQLDKYIKVGINSDHETSSSAEAIERIRKGQWIMIRQGTAARNVEALLPLFDEPYNHRCLLVTDDLHPADLLQNGHIDNIIRLAIKAGKSPVTAIKMATIQAAQCFSLNQVGAIAPGYQADLLVLDDLQNITIHDVYSSGKKIVSKGQMSAFKKPKISEQLKNIVYNSFHLDFVTAKDFYLASKSEKCRVIKLIPGELINEEWITKINWNKNNGIDTNRDILKLAVIERHHHTGHMGIGFINGIGLKKGAIASSVCHDSHNVIVIGTNDEDMVVAVNRIKQLSGGFVVVVDGIIVSELPLPIAGLMTDLPAHVIAQKNEALRQAVYKLGVPENAEPFMVMSFVSLTVIPVLKMSTRGLVDVMSQKCISLYVE